MRDELRDYCGQGRRPGGAIATHGFGQVGVKALALLVLLAGCQGESPTPASAITDATPPKKEALWIELVALSWKDMGGTEQELSLGGAADSARPVAVEWSESYRRKLADGAVEDSDLPRLRFRFSKGSSLRYRHRLLSREARTAVFENGGEIVKDAGSDQAELRLSPDLLGRFPLRQPSDWSHEIALEIAREGESKRTLLLLDLVPSSKKTPLQVTLLHHSSEEAAERRRYEMARVPSGSDWTKPLLAPRSRIARREPFARLEVVSAGDPEVPETLECRSRVVGEDPIVQYTRAYQTHVPRSREGGLLSYSVPLGLETLGDLSWLAGPETRFEMKCRRGEEEGAEKNDGGNKNTFSFTFKIEWVRR